MSRFDHPPSSPAPGRIALVHALPESVVPISMAFAEHWPEVDRFNLLDDSLAVDRSRTVETSEAITARVMSLIQYAVNPGPESPPTRAVVFTGTAFGPALRHARHAVQVPVLAPNEAAFRDAAMAGGRIGLLVTFQPSFDLLLAELHEAVATAGTETEIQAFLVDGALAALQSGDAARHDRLIAEAAARCDADQLVLGQYSMARAAATVTLATGKRVLTTPASTVKFLRASLQREHCG